ncbi:MAG TPA: hypothetical protein DDZ51_19910 [Planctomycetaceae bacterium]|nr:hypothetical protein [Planctomycetaceae bacterium]
MLAMAGRDRRSSQNQAEPIADFDNSAVGIIFTRSFRHRSGCERNSGGTNRRRPADYSSKSP